MAATRARWSCPCRPCHWNDEMAPRQPTQAEEKPPAGRAAPPALSGYRIMWLFVLFDLPVGTKGERKAATKFRLSLPDLGFELSQFSFYLPFSASKQQPQAVARKAAASLPGVGHVHLVELPDKQYETIRTLRKRRPKP